MCILCTEHKLSEGDTVLSTTSHTPEVDVDHYIVEDAKWQTGFTTQLFTLTHRGFVVAKDRFFSKLNFGQIIFIALVAGCKRVPMLLPPGSAALTRN